VARFDVSPLHDERRAAVGLNRRNPSAAAVGGLSADATSTGERGFPSFREPLAGFEQRL